MATFDQLVSPEQKELSALVTTSGGVEALRDNDKMLLVLEETANRASSTPGAEGHGALRTKVGDTDDLKIEIFEDPTAGVERNQSVFFRKFEAQKIQIVDELVLAVLRESDRVIEEVKGGPHEQIRDRVSRPTPYPSPTCMPHYSPFLQSIHEIWKVMVDIMFPSIYERGPNLIVSVGLALECQGSTFCTRSPGLLFSLTIITNSRSERLDDYRLSKFGCMGNQIHRYRPTATYFRGNRRRRVRFHHYRRDESIHQFPAKRLEVSILLHQN